MPAHKKNSSFISSPGSPLPMGATPVRGGINFSLFSRHATAVSLLFFKSGAGEQCAEIVLDPVTNRTGNIWHTLVHDLDPGLRYGYRVEGPWDPQGAGHHFKGDQILLDPYARALTGGSVWGEEYHRTSTADPYASYQRRCCLITDEFDWEGDRPLGIPLKDSVIYELHVRGFTRHSTSGVEYPGTYQGIVEKIPYLKDLGITAVELLPITEFNENELITRNPRTKVRLKNLWGYSPLAFFAPKAAYAVNGRNGNQVNEFKAMVKALHQAGIEVILDIVFNHTAEGGADGPVYSFRGLDNSIYYILGKDLEYLNFSGCGNTMNCNHPLVRSLIMDCLRYWVVEMHVDGFRFDLASVLGRDSKGHVLENPPMIEQIAEDPVLAGTKIIAEAWDASGLYQVGSFSPHPRWAEWNGRFRDDVRAFMAGHDNTVSVLATRISGSADLYQRHGLAPFNSINFITSHDGFTLADLVAYERKHNKENGEDNRDGDNNNVSWNSGVEGECHDPRVIALRARRVRTLAIILFLSQGTPMMVAGDEFGRSQQGNNNAYCQDNSVSWLNWNLLEENRSLHHFFRMLIDLRHRHPIFRRADFFHERPPGSEEIRWQGLAPDAPDWSPKNKTLGLTLLGGEATERWDDDFVILLNGGLKQATFTLPIPPAGRKWHRLINTGATGNQDILAETKAPPARTNRVSVLGMGGVVLISQPEAVRRKQGGLKQ
ncbi:MAG: glycogen debranching protein GlgX [Proteobacteria bacterium]|nr:glycogen debranching protein GlgX [Pseudomonadota bacterium]MBU1688140.1 glycogen debranching protein GlgX [Pseudomonadota bacterium]